MLATPAKKKAEPRLVPSLLVGKLLHPADRSEQGAPELLHRLRLR
jgi:hypothetical protein